MLGICKDSEGQRKGGTWKEMRSCGVRGFWILPRRIVTRILRPRVGLLPARWNLLHGTFP
jgi:hypothetical protein